MNIFARDLYSKTCYMHRNSTNVPARAAETLKLGRHIVEGVLDPQSGRILQRSCKRALSSSYVANVANTVACT